MRRSLAGLLAGILIVGLSLAGCGGQTAPSASAPVSPGGMVGSTDQETESVPEKGEETSVSSEQAAPETVPEEEQPEEKQPEEEVPKAEGETAMKLKVQIGEHVFTATPEDNAAAVALLEMAREAPVIIEMRDYSGFEKVGPLGTSLPASDRQTTTRAGDIVLYTGNQIVIFYGSNSWSYTRLGRIDDLTGWEEALGGGSVTVTFTAGE